jgi:hypothetical protein
MSAKPTDDGNPHHSDGNLANLDDDAHEAVAAQIIGRLAKDWSLLQKRGAPLPKTEGWFPPRMPPRGCPDC